MLSDLDIYPYEFQLINDIGFVIILPTIAFIGFISNLFSAIIFSRLKSAKIYKYLLMKSIIDCLNLLTIGFIPISRCKGLCGSLSYKYESKFYDLYFYSYATHVYNFISTCIGIAVVVERYVVISGTIIRVVKIPIVFNLFFICIIGAVAYVPLVLSRKISLTNSTNSTDAGNLFILKESTFGEEYMLVVFITYFLADVIPFVIIVVAIVMLAYNITKKPNFVIKTIVPLRKGRRSERRMAMMIIGMAVLHGLRQFTDSTLLIVNFYLHRAIYIVEIGILAGNIFMYSTFLFYIFIYYKFNKSFAVQVKNIMGIVKSKRKFSKYVF